MQKNGYAQTPNALSGKSSRTASEVFEEAMVWVKLKQSYSGLLSATNGRARALPGVAHTRPLLSATQRPSGRRGPLNQSVDITLYHTLLLEKGASLESTVASLTATGFFEVVEPIPVNRPLVTPNDPSFGLQPYLNLVKATEAWDIAPDNGNVIIGIVDTGGDLDHPDLNDRIYVDPQEPIDGIDNDGDGYVDNNRGWDFSGAIAANVGTPGFEGDNDPSVAKAGLFGHGTMVAGCAAASTNNGIGIASVGRGARLLFTKHYSDDQDANAANYSSNTYLGVLYAATHGARIINCSWGSYNPSTIAQDLINYVTKDLGCIVIAAAGNSNLETPIYPASYNNVLSVGATTITDERTYFSNFGRTVDLVAPGTDIFTTQYNDAYVYEGGTSLSAPVVSGAAALVWSVFPEFTGLQVAEQLRVSADASIYDRNPLFLNKLGYGRLDVLSALTKQGPSVRVDNQQLLGEDHGSPRPGQTVSLLLDFTNYLKPTSGTFYATISTSSPYATVTKGSYAIGSLATGQTRTNDDAPFQLSLSAGLPRDEVIEILVTLTDRDYEDHQLINVSIPSYIDIRENNIITSLAANGRIAYGAPESQANGSGFLYNEEHLLYEMGLVMGTSPTDLYNNVRAVGALWDADFVPLGDMRKETPGGRSYSEVSGAMKSADSRLEVEYKSLVWNDDPNRNFVIVEYTVKNTTPSDIADFYMGLFADWDIGDQGAHDRADWDSDTRLGYVYSVGGLQMPRVGVQVLTGQPQYHAIDNDQSVPGNPFGIYDGFTDNEKFTSVSEGVARTTAGASGAGGDVSHTVGSGPYLIRSGQEITLAFALHAAMSQADLIASAKQADTIYNYTLKAPVPVIAETKACMGLPTTLRPTGAVTYSLYKTATGGLPVATGEMLDVGPMLHDSVVYIANADHHYESLRTPAVISVVARPHVTASSATEFCSGEKVILKTSDGESYLWSTGETTPTISVSTAGIYAVEVVRDGISCPSENNQNVLVHPLPDASFTTSPAVPVADQVTVFSATDNGAASWLWQVKNGESGNGPEFQYTFPTEGMYTVNLTVTDEHECVSTSSVDLGLITGIESALEQVAIYPNPVVGDRMQIRLPADAEVFLEVIDVLSRQLLTRSGKASEITSIDTGGLHNGQYILRITCNGRMITQKFTIAR